VSGSSFAENEPGILDRASGATVVEAGAGVGTWPTGVFGCGLFRVPRFDDNRGSLVVNASPGDLPFTPVRIFQVFNVLAGEMRGDHAHRRCHQYLIAAHGEVDMVIDDATSRSLIRLSTPELGLHIPPLVWGIQTRFSHDALLVVLASELYDRHEYITEYAEFLRLRALG
jgi:UDP-2-acetamido-3-amino-2,3-dideoxy-glucuronate N-acetyltransferase